jgi:hypothetical protein
MVAFATYNRERLKNYNLIATGSTGKLLQEKVGLEVEPLQSGPYGGDAQVGWGGENHPVGQGGQGAAVQQEQNHNCSEQQLACAF